MTSTRMTAAKRRQGDELIKKAVDRYGAALRKGLNEQADLLDAEEAAERTGTKEKGVSPARTKDERGFRLKLIRALRKINPTGQ